MFKNNKALNGHMRLHGGFDWTKKVQLARHYIYMHVHSMHGILLHVQDMVIYMHNTCVHNVCYMRAICQHVTDNNPTCSFRSRAF